MYILRGGLLIHGGYERQVYPKHVKEGQRGSFFF